MLRWWRKRGRGAVPVPDALWDDTLSAYPFLARRPASDIAALRALAGQFLAAKEFHGAQGFAITDSVALAIAAQAVLPVMHLGLHWYDDFVGIVVHADEVIAPREVMDDSGVVHQYDELLAGESMDGGPVTLSWRDVAGAGASAEEGYNVVIHEFIHKIDLRDGQSDGCPPLRQPAARRQWQDTMARHYDAFREQVIVAERFGGEPPWLDAYGAEAIDEFFAVACEAYFVNRPRFAQDFAGLLPLFDGFFGPR